MYKNQLQELAQRSCFNLPSYTSTREGPDHAPRFKAAVNFNGETFESTGFFTTLRQAEHSAAEVALAALSTRGPSHSLTARILDETGVYKNLLQEIAQRVGAPLPSYTTTRSCLGHPPVFTGTVEIAGIVFTGEPAKNKKQAEKNSAMAAWSSLKQLAQQEASTSTVPENNEEQEQVTLARALLTYRLREKTAALADNPDAAPFPKLFPLKAPDKKPLLDRLASPSASKLLPFLQQRAKLLLSPAPTPSADSAGGLQQLNFAATGAAPYVPIRHCRPYNGGMVPPVTVRTAVPVFSAPPHPFASGNAVNGYHMQPQQQQQQQWGGQPVSVKCSNRPPSVHLRHSIPSSNPCPPALHVRQTIPASTPCPPAVRVRQSVPASAPCPPAVHVRQSAPASAPCSPAVHARQSIPVSNPTLLHQVKPVVPAMAIAVPVQREIQPPAKAAPTGLTPCQPLAPSSFVSIIEKAPTPTTMPASATTTVPTEILQLPSKPANQLPHMLVQLLAMRDREATPLPSSQRLAEEGTHLGFVPSLQIDSCRRDSDADEDQLEDAAATAAGAAAAAESLRQLEL